MQTTSERIKELTASLERHRRLSASIADTITDVNLILAKCVITIEKLRKDKNLLDAQIEAVNSHLENLLSEPASEVAVPESQSP